MKAKFDTNFVWRAFHNYMYLIYEKRFKEYSQAKIEKDLYVYYLEYSDNLSAI